MCKLLKETEKWEEKTLNSEKALNLKTAGNTRLEVYFLPNYLISSTCVYIYTTGKALKRPMIESWALAAPGLQALSNIQL